MVAPATTLPTSRTKGTAFVLAGILLVALNLRAAITSLGPLLDEVRVGLHFSGAMAGVVTTMPTIAFAVFGAVTPWLVRRFAPSRVLVAAMVALVAGEAVRVSTGSTAVFVATSALALAGIAVANILLPLLVRQHFPERTGLITGAYTVSLTAGATVAAASAVPIADAFGSWRAGLGAWTLLAAVAVLPWLPILRRRTGARAVPTAAGGRVRAGRTRLGWAMAVYFGTQALSGYATIGWLAQLFRDSGYRPQSAGLLLAAVTAVGIPVALAMPTLATRLGNLRPLVLVLAVAMISSYVGLALAPHGGALAWVVLLAIGQGAFPLSLVVIGLRARTPEGTVALSAFTQCVGYLIAALGPLVVGALYEATGGWRIPLVFLIAAALVQLVAGLAVSRVRYVED
ncbi:CynX/NimT family MFS transporter [Phytohabitans rumicis]|uniref:MFS transporter n=1 Tax=Phytohabitans rumicis TaxID=1076125 RepID=A0A6V8L272_9ACTN|nr:MFS transporter [Phytohabitans rumicis]GFJ90244.1 MFS transporter [Phytohabitans rumicis]